MLNTWTLALARRDYEIGYLEGWTIDREAMATGWIVILRGHGKMGPLVDARTKTERRIFVTLDAAVSALTTIGFQVNRLR